MITNFALSLSLDGIELLHRVPRGWRPVGRVDVASETLEEDLSALREKALLIEPDGLRTKLVIPLDQIKYIALDGTLTSEADIDAALDGATPYALSDLIIDSEKSGGRTHVAAVARDTLNEAEAFAEAHGFQPVAFVAIPEPFTFQKEVFFGPTDMARSIVGPDAIIDRDDLPVMPVGTRIKSRLLVFDQPDDVEEDTFKDDLAALLASQNTPDADVTTEVVETTEDTPDPTPKQAIWVDRIPAEYHAPDVPEIVTQPPVPAEIILAKPVLVDLVIPEHHRKAKKKTKSPLVAVFGGPKVAAPSVSVGIPTPKAEAAPVTPEANRPTAPQASRPTATPETNKRPALIAAGLAAAVLVLGGVIWSQQGPVETAAIPPTTQVTAEQTPAEPQVVTQAAPQAVPLAEVGPEIAEIVIPEFAAPQTRDSDLAAIGTEPPAERSTPPAEIAVAEADAPLTAVQAPPAPPAEETAQAAVGAPVLRGQVLSPDEADRIYEVTGVWQRAPRFFDVPSGAIPLEFDRPAGTTAPEQITQPEMAQLDGFATDLSFIAPANPPAPDVTFARDADGFILATEEGTVTPEGAIVFAGLPDLVITPRPELSQSDLDRMALLAPAPEGVVIISGTPAVVPPLRPADAALPQTEETPVDESDVDAAVAAVTSEPAAPTPGGVGLGGLELQNTGTIGLDPGVVEERAIVDLRPRLRPQGLATGVDPGTPDITDILASIEVEDATLRFDNSTALAVVLSVRPDARPSNFANVVAAASARAQTQPAAPAPSAPASAAPVVAAAPVAPQNFQPVPGGVARAATQEDAIRLREINLIGVYGRPNARRALVRLSNGRYVRVEVGSELDGGQVTAIGDRALNYVKRGRTYAIELP
ncbi:MAG: hypothetical protein ACSHXW_08600 [Yoonia sp.]